MYEDKVNLIFLIFITILVSSVIYRLSNKTLIVSLVAVFASLGAYGSGCFQKETAWGKRRCRSCMTAPEYVSKRINSECENGASRARIEKEIENEIKNEIEKRAQIEKEFGRQLDADLNESEHSYNEPVCPGDNILSLRMWENGKRSKQAMDHRAKFDKYSMLHYFDDELRCHANSIWWDDDSLEHKF